MPDVDDLDIERRARDAQRYAVAYQRISTILENSALTRDEMADLLAKDFAASLAFYQETE